MILIDLHLIQYNIIIKMEKFEYIVYMYCKSYYRKIKMGNYIIFIACENYYVLDIY